MGLIRAFKQFLNPQLRSTGADDNIIISGGGLVGNPPTKVQVNDDIAMKIATVKRCLQIKCGEVATLGLHLKERKKSDISGRYFFAESEKNLDWLLSRRPNDRMNAYWFLFNLIYLKEMTGNAYVYPVYEGGEVASLILLSPNSVTEDKDTDTYHIHDTVNKIFTDVHSEQIIVIRNMSMDGGYTGISTLHFAANTLGISYKTDQQQEAMFTPGSMLRGFITGDGGAAQGFGHLQDSQLKDTGDRIRQAVQSGYWLNYLPGTMKYVPVGISAADMQLLESKKFTVTEICRFFDVPPEQVFLESSTNYKGSENSQTIFMTSTLMPMLAQIENEFMNKLIPCSVSRRYKIQFDLDNYYQSDITAKANYYQKMVQSGAMTPNEVREREGKAPVDGGDEVFISCNVAPIKSAKITGEQQSQQPKDPANGK